MATVVVALNNAIRQNDADANTNWSNLGGGGPAPASEPQLRYQYSGTGSVGAVNRKITTTASRTGVQFEGGTTRDLSNSSVYGAGGLVILKGYVTDFSDLNSTYGVEMRIGSSSANFREYNVAGGGANSAPFDNGYPQRGGYLIAAINPTILGYRNTTDTGTPDLTAVDYFALAAQFITGGTKDVNLAMDAIDLVTGANHGLGGLLLTRGDSTDADGVFQDFADWDEGTLANRYGMAINFGSIVQLRGMMTIGESATETRFTDSSAVVVFPDGYHGAGQFGIRYNIENASTVIIAGSTFIGEGNQYPDVDFQQDSRPDLIVVGTSGTCTLDGAAVSNHRRLKLNGGTTMRNASVRDSGQITIDNEDYGGYQTLDGTGDYIDAQGGSFSHTWGIGVGTFSWVGRYRLTDWTPASRTVLFYWDGGTSARIDIGITTGGNLEVIVNGPGAASTTHTSSTALPLTDGEWAWLSVVVAVDGTNGNARFSYSLDPADTPPRDIAWIENGTQDSGTARNFTAITGNIAIGGTTAGGSLVTGDVSYCSLWEGGHADEVRTDRGMTGLQIFEADWRTGPDFTGSPGTRADDLDASLVWEENGDPVYTTADNLTSPVADISGSLISNTTSYAALRWDVNLDPNGELDDTTWSIPVATAAPGVQSLASVTGSGTTQTFGVIPGNTLPGLSSMALLFVGNTDGAAGPDVPTVVGSGVEWHQRGTVVASTGSNETRLTVFAASMYEVNNADLSTVSFASSQTAYSISVVEVESDNVDPIQVVTNTGNGTTASATMAAMSDSLDMVVASIVQISTSNPFEPGTGWTEVHDQNAGTSYTHQTQYQANDNNPDWTGGSANDWAVIAVEVSPEGARPSHAIEFGKNTPSSITLTGPTFSGYSPGNDAVDSTFYNNSGKALTISIDSGSGPATYRNGVGASTTVQASVTLTVTASDTTGTGIASVRVRIENATTEALISQGTANGSGVYTDSFNYSSDVAVRIIVRKSSTGATRYQPAVATSTITNTGLNVEVTMVEDEIASA